jgi:RNA polymerase sigma-70 factor (ECF subfamily)
MNTAADHRKKRRGDRAVLIDDVTKLPLVDPGEGPDADLGRNDLKTEVRRAMAALPENFRAILVLRELEGLSYQEIGTILDLNKGTVESRLFRARARLKEHLERTMRSR